MRFLLHPIPPFRLDLTAWALRRRAHNETDRWDGETYGRTIAVGGRAIDVEVTARGSALRVVAHAAAPSARAALASALTRALGLRIDLGEFYRLARRDRYLADLADRFRGLKPPRFPSVFEAVVNGIACQQLSLSVGILLLDRLTRRCGLRSASGRYAFPRATDLAALRPSQLRALGFNPSKTRALLELARSGLDLERLSELPDEAVVERLTGLYGIGRWTAEYVVLRGLGRLRMFPGDDVGARTNLARWMKLRTPLDYDRVRALSRRWQPYAGFLYFHLLLQALADAGELAA